MHENEITRYLKKNSLTDRFLTCRYNFMVTMNVFSSEKYSIIDKFSFFRFYCIFIRLLRIIAPLLYIFNILTNFDLKYRRSAD